MSKSDEKPEIESIAKNRRARHDYSILTTYEAGIVLTGSEVKSLRSGKANISDAYGIVKDGEVHLLNLHISPYEQASYFNHEPTRTRKLLLHKREIRKNDRLSRETGSDSGPPGAVFPARQGEGCPRAWPRQEAL